MTNTRDDQADRTAELSEAARAAVRDPGDPRIDAHLAALGLAPDSPPSRRQPAAVPAGGSESEVAALRDRIAGLEASLASASSRVRVLAVALGVALVADAILALLVLRPG